MLEREELAEDDRELEVVSVTAMASAICATRKNDTQINELVTHWKSETCGKKENKVMSIRKRMVQFGLVVILQQKMDTK